MNHLNTVFDPSDIICKTIQLDERSVDRIHIGLCAAKFAYI